MTCTFSWADALAMGLIRIKAAGHLAGIRDYMPVRRTL